jgi:2-polyprenyl-3-methyl-5-hydroxy-6-metoxy-1,4-benzoquinol methylase
MFVCRLCGCREARDIRVTDAKEGGPLPIAFCTGCGMVQQSVLPSAQDLRVYYGHSYRHDYKGVHTPKLKHVRRAGLAAVSRLETLMKAGAARKGARLLDIGAGGGEFVYLAGRSGFAAEGIEPNLGYSEFARAEYSSQIRTMPLDDLEHASADVVTLFHVLEHLADPLAAFRKLHDVLSDDGLLFIEVPNILQADASPHNVFFKAHLFYYSRHTLQGAGSRYFEPVLTEERGNLRMLMRKRAAPLDTAVLPDPETVDFAWQRLRRKGWVEYLTVGGGLRKPWRRIRQAIAERRLAGRAPRQLLDEVFDAGALRG